MATGGEPLKGRVAIVTGGAGNVGSAICTHLANLGASVVIDYIGDGTPAIQLSNTINSAHPSSSPLRAIAVEADVSDPAQVKSLFDQAELTFGRPHILVTAAAVQDFTFPFLADTTLEQWELAFNVNAKGAYLCCREAANRLVRGGGGRIVMVSSSSIGLARLGFGAYASTKGAVEVMVRILAKELRGTGITVNGVAPGTIATPAFLAAKTEEELRRAAGESPLERLGRAEDVAPVVGFLAGDGAEWINGQIIRINGQIIRPPHISGARSPLCYFGR